MWKARSSSDQRAVGKPTSAGFVVARQRSLWRSSGGKSGRSAGAGQVLQSGQALASEAPTPLGDRVGVAAEFTGNMIVAGLIRSGTAQDQSSAKGQGLGRGMRPHPTL